MALKQTASARSPSISSFAAPEPHSALAHRRLATMKRKPHRKRLDALLVERSLASTLQKAQAMILAGEVRVSGAPAAKPGATVSVDAAIEVTSRTRKYVSRGGHKLEGALDDFSVDVHGAICADIGASTGGFTDCLLQNGAARVFAVDVSTDQLDWKLRRDHRVILVERNARELAPGDISEPVDIVVADVSFISATKILKPAAAIAKPGAHLLILVKPQFELPREDHSGAIVEDVRLHGKAIAAVREALLHAGLEILGDVRPSRLKGAEGNQEYFLHALKKPVG